MHRLIDNYITYMLIQQTMEQKYEEALEIVNKIISLIYMSLYLFN